MLKKPQFLFDKYNYIILIISLLFIIIGFLLMIGGGGETPYDYNPEIFSPQRIVIAPIVIVMGYIGMILSIFYHD